MILISNLIVHHFYKLASHLFFIFFWIFQKSVLFATLFKFYQGLDNQVTDVNSWMDWYLTCILWSAVAYCAFGPSRLVKLLFFWWFFKRCVLRYLFALSYQRNLIINGTESLFDLTFWEILTVFFLTDTFLTKFLTATKGTLINLFFSRLWHKLDLLPCNGPLFINFLEKLIIDILQIDSKTFIEVGNWPFSIFAIRDKHFVVLSCWHKQVKRQFVDLIWVGITLGTGVIFEVFGLKGAVWRVYLSVESDSPDWLG